MGSPSAVVCREIFDENSQPSAEEISEYAHQLGIDPESESHLLPLARDGLMQALPAPWKAYYNEKLQTHYYYNEETKKTQWEHPLDKVYKELVKKARDASIHDDTCASVQELLTFEENPKILERTETKVDSDDEELTTESSRHLFDSKNPMPQRLAPLGRPPLAPLTRLDKKLGELRMSPLRRSMDQPLKPSTVKNPDRDFFRPPVERPKQLFKQQSEIIDLKINVLNSPEDDNFSPLLGSKLSKIDRGLPLTGKGSIFFKIPKSEHPSPDTEKSFPLDSASMTKSDPPKGILREKHINTLQRKLETATLSKARHSASLEEDKKSVRFQLENPIEPSTISPSSNSSSDQNDGQSSIATPTAKPLHPLNLMGPITLAPLVARPPIPPKVDSPKGTESNKTFVTTKEIENTKIDVSKIMESERNTFVDIDSETSLPSPTPSVPDPRPKTEMENPFTLNIPTVDSPNLDSPKLKESLGYIASPKLQKNPENFDCYKVTENPRSILSPESKGSARSIVSHEANEVYIKSQEEVDSSRQIDVSKADLIQTNSCKEDHCAKLINNTSDNQSINASPRNNSLLNTANERDSSTTSDGSEDSSKKSTSINNPDIVPLEKECMKTRSRDVNSNAANSPTVSDDHKSVGSESSHSPKRRVLRPPAGDYIKPDLFQKNFQKISDLVRPGDINTSPVNLDVDGDRDVRPRSPLIPQQKSKISINLMESIESETSTESPDKDYDNLDLDDLDNSDNNVEQAETDKSAKVSNTQNVVSNSSQKSVNSIEPVIDNSISLKQKRVPKLDLPNVHSDSDNSIKTYEIIGNAEISQSDFKSADKSLNEIKSPQVKSPKFDWNKPSSPSSFKPPNKAVIAPLKFTDSSSNFGKSLSPRLDGVIISQGKSTDNVVVVYQFESQDENYTKTIKSPLLPDSGRDVFERNKADERRRLEIALQKELENIRVEFTSREKIRKAVLQEELKELEEKFITDKKMKLKEQAERQKEELETAIALSEKSYQDAIIALNKSIEERRKKDVETLERKHIEEMAELEKEYRAKLEARRHQLELEYEREVSECRSQLRDNLSRERSRLVEENRAAVESLREEHSGRVTELRHDYRAEVERLRTQHACHLEELRARLASERAARPEERGLADKYRCLKEKYARLKHDVKMSIERRNKRREMSMTTGSETEKSNSHKATHSLERCKELNEALASAVASDGSRNNAGGGTARVNDPEPTRVNDPETSHSDCHNVTVDNHNDNDRNNSKHNGRPAPSGPRRSTVAFKHLPASNVNTRRDTDIGTTTDYQDSSDGTTADDKPKDALNGHGRRRCFTRLKSASTSRLNYSPNRAGGGWSSPLEALRLQLRKLDDLEDQLPDLSSHNYTLRYPFKEIAPVSKAETPELEFVRHRAIVEREGMRRARAVLKRRRAALREQRGEGEPNEAPSERDAVELEVALHRARALLGEKEIRLRSIERALRGWGRERERAGREPPPAQEVTTSEASSASETVDTAATGEVLRSLRALHADVRDIWRAIDGHGHSASPEMSSFNPTTSSQNRLTVSAPAPSAQNNSDELAERARGLRAWLHE